MTIPRCLFCGDGGMEPYQENSYCQHRDGVKKICIPYYCDNCENWTMSWNLVKPKRERGKTDGFDIKTSKT